MFTITVGDIIYPVKFFYAGDGRIGARTEHWGRVTGIADTTHEAAAALRYAIEDRLNAYSARRRDTERQVAT